MLVLANGQRYLFRVPGGVGDGVGGLNCRGAADAVGVDVGLALALGAGCGVPVADGAAGAVCPSAEPGVFPTVGLGVTALCDCAGPHAAPANAKPMHRARAPRCRARGTHDRAGVPDPDVCLTPT